MVVFLWRCYSEVTGLVLPMYIVWPHPKITHLYLHWLFSKWVTLGRVGREGVPCPEALSLSSSPSLGPSAACHPPLCLILFPVIAKDVPSIKPYRSQKITIFKNLVKLITTIWFTRWSCGSKNHEWNHFKNQTQFGRKWL